MRLNWSFALLATIACGGASDDKGSPAVGDDDDVTGDDDDDDDDDVLDTAHSGIGALVNDAAYLVVTSTFAYDPVTQTALGYEDPTYGPLPLSLSVVFIDSSALQDQVINQFNSCAVTFTTDQPQPVGAFVAANAELWWGYQMPAGAEMVDGCVNFEMPTSFGGDVGAQVARWQWGVAVSEIDPGVKGQIEDQLPPADYARVEPYLIGSGSWSTAFEGLLNAEGYLDGAGNAFEADPNWGLVDDGTGQAKGILAADVYDGTSLARGIYSVSTVNQGPGELVTY